MLRPSVTENKLLTLCKFMTEMYTNVLKLLTAEHLHIEHSIRDLQLEKEI